MKYYISILIFFIVSSCCGTNEVVKTQANTPEEIVEFIPPKTPEIQEDQEIVEIKKHEFDKNIEVEELPIIPQTKGIAEDLELLEEFNHSVFNNLLQKYVSPLGNVNYKGFKSERIELRNYITSLGENMPKHSWTKEDELAYWINAYNALTIDLILRNLTVKSIKDIDKPWEQRLWKLGSKWYNLDEMEHQILRNMNEPRIHFAIVCASVSCPKLQNEAFTASNLETQLTNATKEFLSDTSKNKLSKNSIKLSKIFKWFAKDFKQNQSLVDFLNKYSDIEISQNASKSYMDYNWNLND